MTFFYKNYSVQVKFDLYAVNFRRYAEVRYFLFFVIIFANLIVSFSVIAKSLLAKINILSVYISIMLNKLKL